MPSDPITKGTSGYNITIAYQSIFQTNFLGQAVIGNKLAFYGVSTNQIKDGMMALSLKCSK
jgi:hypothetical protein